MSERKDQLTELLTEEFNELRWRRDMEDRLVNWTIAICSGVLTALVAFVEFAPPPLALAFAVFAAGLMLGVGMRIGKKIDAENRVYQGVGDSIRCILSNDHSFTRVDETGGDKPYIGENLAKIGSGSGAMETKEIVGFATKWTSFAVVVIAFGNYIVQTGMQ